MDKHIPERDRKQASKGSGKLVAGFGSNQRALISLVTAPLARAIVSSLVDRQRLGPADAERKYKELSPDDKYSFIVRVWFLAEGMRPPGMRGHTTKELAHPLDVSTVFLQRADDNGIFARGTATQTDFDLFDGPADYQSKYIVAMSKTTDKGVPVIRDIGDKIELQFEIGGKKSKVTYSLAELASKVDDL